MPCDDVDQPYQVLNDDFCGNVLKFSRLNILRLGKTYLSYFSATSIDWTFLADFAYEHPFLDFWMYFSLVVKQVDDRIMGEIRRSLGHHPAEPHRHKMSHFSPSTQCFCAARTFPCFTALLCLLTANIVEVAVCASECYPIVRHAKIPHFFRLGHFFST